MMCPSSTKIIMFSVPRLVWPSSVLFPDKVLFFFHFSLLCSHEAQLSCLFFQSLALCFFFNFPTLHFPSHTYELMNQSKPIPVPCLLCFTDLNHFFPLLRPHKYFSLRLLLPTLLLFMECGSRKYCCSSSSS